MTKELPDKSLQNARRRFLWSLIPLALSIIYLVFPIDLIPDILGILGMVDDIPILLAAAIYSWYSYRKMKQEYREQELNT